MRNHLGLIGLSLIMLACTHLHRAQPPHLISWSLQSPENKPLADFNRIDIKGRINVHLHTGASHTALKAHADPRDLTHVKWAIQHQSLELIQEKPYPHYSQKANIDIDIYCKNLTSFSYHGKGRIDGQHLRSQGLDLLIHNRGKTQLSGQLNLHQLDLAGKGNLMIQGATSRGLDISIKDAVRAQITGRVNLRRLSMKDHSWLTLYWVSSPVCLIQVKDHARLQLAGKASLINAELFGQSRFNGRYLQTKDAFVKAHDESVADISVTHIQHCLAVDNANIYRHENPSMPSNFLGSNGSILDFKSWEQF